MYVRTRLRFKSDAMDVRPLGDHCSPVIEHLFYLFSYLIRDVGIAAQFIEFLVNLIVRNTLKRVDQCKFDALIGNIA